MHNKHLLKLFSALLVGIGLIFTWFFAIHPSSSYAAPDDGPDRGLVAVQFSPGHQEVREISFTAPISGLLALQMTGYPIEVGVFGWGIAVCSINGVGCPAEDCFCDPTHFWSNEYWDGSQWEGYSVGAASTEITDGAIEGWRWTEWGVGGLPPAPQLTAAASALNWLAGQQSADDGGYGGLSASVESLISIGSNGLFSENWRRSPTSPSLHTYIFSKGAAFSNNSSAAAGKLAVALAGADGCLAYNTKMPMDYFQADQGWFSQDAGNHSWAILGTVALGQPVPSSAILYLKSIQQSDGGWEWTPGGFGGGTDTNTTALAIQALIAAGEPADSSEILDALDYLHASQKDDGGFPYDADSPYDTDSDANSTASVIQALIAAGEDLSDWSPAGSSPVEFLLSLQLGDGSLEWQPGSGANLMATQQAISALLGRPYPLALRMVGSCPGIYLPVVSR